MKSHKDGKIRALSCYRVSALGLSHKMCYRMFNGGQLSSDLQVACIDCTKYSEEEQYGHALALACHFAYLSILYLLLVSSVALVCNLPVTLAEDLLLKWVLPCNVGLPCEEKSEGWGSPCRSSGQCRAWKASEKHMAPA